MSAFWVSVGLNVILGIFIPIIVAVVWELQKLKYEQIWHVYHLNVENKKRYITGLKSIGRFYKMREDKKRNRFELIFKKDLKLNYYYSSYTQDMLVSLFKIHKYLFINYELNCQVFERTLSATDQYERESLWPWYFHIYEVIVYLFSFAKGSGGIFGSIFIGILSLTGNPSDGAALAWGCGVALFIEIILTWAFKTEKLNIRPKTEDVKTETWIEPIFPNKIIEDLYTVTYIEQIPKNQDDSTADIEPATIEKKNVTILELNELETDNRYEVKAFVKTGFREQTYRVDEVQALQKSFAFKVRDLYHMISDLRAENNRIQETNNAINQQLQRQESERDKEIAAYNRKILAERRRSRETLKTIFAKMVGADVVEKKWEAVAHRAIQDFEREMNSDAIKRLEILTETLEKVISRVAKENKIDLSKVLGLDLGEEVEASATG